MTTFSQIPVGAFFEFEGFYWCKWDTDANGWNAVSGKRWGQFEDDEQCQMMDGTVPNSIRKNNEYPVSN